MLARRLLFALAPGTMGRFSRAAAAADRLEREQDQLAHLQERQGEQIERLEDLAREQVLALEALRGRIETLEARALPGEPGSP